MAKPTNLALWATNTNYPATSDPIKVEPSTGVKEAGWAPNQKPPAQWWNWWMNAVYLWMVWLDAFESTDHIWTKEQTFTADDVAGDAGAVFLAGEFASGFLGWSSFAGPDGQTVGDMIKESGADPVIAALRAYKSTATRSSGPGLIDLTSTDLIAEFFGNSRFTIGDFTATDLFGAVGAASSNNTYAAVIGFHTGNGHALRGNAAGTGAGVYGYNSTSGPGLKGLADVGPGGYLEGTTYGIDAYGLINGTGGRFTGAGTGYGVIGAVAGANGTGGYFSGAGTGSGLEVAGGNLKLSGTPPAANAAAANKLSTMNFVKAQGTITTNGAGAVTLETNGQNVASVSIVGNNVHVVFAAPMSSPEYQVLITNVKTAAQAVIYRSVANVQIAASFDVGASNSTDNSDFPFASTALSFSFIVVGRQP